MSRLIGIPLVLFSLLFAFDTYAEPTLKVGDKAPELKISKWLNGKGIRTFEPNKIYILEFWATWCAPCIEQIPHLNELAKKYTKDVVVFGVADRENEKTIEEKLAAITNFMKTNQPPQEYLIGVDGTGQMNTLWQKASEAPGIPNVYVIDRDGIIAFMGHPAYLDSKDLGNPLKKIVEGTWKNSKEKAIYEEENRKKQVQQEKLSKLMGDFRNALAKEDWEAARVSAQVAGIEMPFFRSMEAKLLIERLSKPAEAITILKDLIQTDWEDTDSLSSYIELLVHEKLMGTPYVDLQLAYSVAKRTIDLLENPKTDDQKYFHDLKWFYYARVANYYFAIGQNDQAIHFQQMALEGMPEENRKDHFINFTADLKKYKSLDCVGGVCNLPAENCDEILNAGKK